MSTVPPKTALVFLCYELPFNAGNIIFDQSGRFDNLKKQKLSSPCSLCFFLTTGGAGGCGGLRGLQKAGQRYVAHSGDILQML